ncbi:MAG: DUF262 domain-containing protein [Clostridiaceae bacterium]
MQNGNVKIEELFNGDRIFNIPKYQRAYAWEKDNLEIFYDDLKNQRGAKDYFFGTLLFHQRENMGEYECYDVVDGQQRLTTIIIFLKVLIGKLLEKGSILVSKKTYQRYIYDEYAFKLEMQNEDTSFLHEYILGKNEDVQIKYETPAQRKLKDAKDYFIGILSNRTVEELERLFTILKASDVILYVVNDISDATHIFELLNDRGRQLTKLEEIKSFLMYRISCLDIKNNNQPIDDIQNAFSYIYRIIESSNLNEDDVLRYHTIAFENSLTDDYDKPSKYIKRKINNYFEEQADDVLIKKEILTYVSNLKDSFTLSNDINKNIDDNRDLDRLFMIERVNPFYPLLMHMKKNNPEELYDFIKDLVQFTFRSSLIGLRNNNESFYHYIREHKDYRNIFKIIVKENWWNINNRVNEFINYNNYYVWINSNIVKFILFEYENHLRETKGFPLLTINEYFSTDRRKKLSIEHITARKSKLNFKEAFNEEFLHSIGNLVIDTVSSNSRKGNDLVTDKEKEYGIAPLMSQNEINDYTVNWNNLKDIKLFIKEREKRMRSFIRTILLKESV